MGKRVKKLIKKKTNFIFFQFIGDHQIFGLPHSGETPHSGERETPHSGERETPHSGETPDLGETTLLGPDRIFFGFFGH